MQGVGFRAHVYRLAERARAAPAGCSTTSAGCCSRSRRDPETVAAFLARLTADAPPLARGRAGGAPGARAGAATPASRSCRSRSGGESRAPISRRHGDLRGTACASCSIPPIAATAIRSSTAPTAGRGSRSSAASPTTARSPRWPASRCAASCQAEYDDPVDRRFHAQPNACPDVRARRRACSTPTAGELELPGASDAVARRRRRRCATGRSWPSRGSAAITWPAAPMTSPRWPLCARASSARTSRSRSWPPICEAAPGLVCLGPTERELLRSPRAPDRAGPAPRRRAGGAPSVAPGSAELGVMLPYSPLHHLLTGTTSRGDARAWPRAGDDQRQRHRRADRLPRRRRASSASAAIADVFLVPRPPDPHAHRRLGALPPCRTAPRGRARCCCALARVRARRASPLPDGAGSPRRSRCGAELKNTFCLAKERRAWVVPSHRRPRERRDAALVHRGRRALRAGVRASTPEVVAHDLHPDYLSTQYAHETATSS